MARIAISYRRADSAAMSGRIFDRLVAKYGEESVFMDIDSIPPGYDFREKLSEALAAVDVVVAVIGAGWLGHEANGRVRIKETTDVLRIEIETALSRRIPVIPVLIDGAPMPQPDDLPEAIRAFAFYNAAEVDSGRDFRIHMDRLITAMDAMLAPPAKPQPPQAMTAPPVVQPSPEPKAKPQAEPAPSPRSDPPQVRAEQTSLRVEPKPEPAPKASAGLPSWIPFAAFTLVPGLLLIVIYFAITIDGTLGVTIIHALLAVVLAAGAGFAAQRRLGYVGGRSAALGLAIGIVGMFGPWLYQLQGRYAAMPFLTGAVEINALTFAAGAALACLSGNLWAQFAAAGRTSRTPSGAIAGWAARSGQSAANILSIAAGVAGVAALAVEYAAWFPYCRAFGLLDYCM